MENVFSGSVISITFLYLVFLMFLFFIATNLFMLVDSLFSVKEIHFLRYNLNCKFIRGILYEIGFLNVPAIFLLNMYLVFFALSVFLSFFAIFNHTSLRLPIIIFPLNLILILIFEELIRVNHGNIFKIKFYQNGIIYFLSIFFIFISFIVVEIFSSEFSLLKPISEFSGSHYNLAVIPLITSFLVSVFFIIGELSCERDIYPDQKNLISFFYFSNFIYLSLIFIILPFKGIFNFFLDKLVLKKWFYFSQNMSAFNIFISKIILIFSIFVIIGLIMSILKNYLPKMNFRSRLNFILVSQLFLLILTFVFSL